MSASACTCRVPGVVNTVAVVVAVLSVAFTVAFMLIVAVAWDSGNSVKLCTFMLPAVTRSD